MAFPETRSPTTGQGGRADSAISNFNADDIATNEKANQPETALAAAFREAARRKAVAS
jgi:hypothetical protein